MVYWAQVCAVTAEIERLGAALLASDERPQIVMKMLAEREKLLATPSVLDLDVRRMESEARTRIAQLQAMLERNPEEARQVMRALFPTPLKLTPIETDEGKRFWIEGAASIGGMFAADRGCHNSASPAGFERWCTRRIPLEFGFRSPWSASREAGSASPMTSAQLVRRSARDTSRRPGSESPSCAQLGSWVSWVGIGRRSTHPRQHCGVQTAGGTR